MQKELKAYSRVFMYGILMVTLAIILQTVGCSFGGEKEWEFGAGNWVTSSPAVSGGYVYVGSVDKKLYCVNAANGKKVWEFFTGMAAGSSPAVSGGYVYVGSYGKFYCLKAVNGEKVWEFKTGSWVTSSPTISGGYVYVGSWDNMLYCLNAANGEKVWEFKTAGQPFGLIFR